MTRHSIGLLRMTSQDGSLNQDDSVTRNIHAAVQGHENAVEFLWERFFHQLVVAARSRCRGYHAGVADEEDIAISVFESVCRGLREGRFPELSDRTGLWRLMLLMAARKSADLVNFETRSKRDSGRRVSIDDDSEDLFLRVIRQPPSPAMEAECTDAIKVLLDRLQRDDLKEIAMLKMEGYTNVEIASRVDRGLSTIERKLATVREIWRRS